MTVGLIILRALIAGAFVVAFSLLGTALKPKRFAGLFSAAPSIALANVVVVVASQGNHAAGDDLLAMTFGAVGFVAYCLMERQTLPRMTAAAASAVSTLAWVAIALGGYFYFLR